MSGSGKSITTEAIALPSSGYELSFSYSFSSTSGFPSVEIRTGASCGTTLVNTTNLANTGATCVPQTIDLSAFAGQTIYIRFVSNSFTSFYLDDILVDVSSGGSGTGCIFAEDFGTTSQSINTTNWPTGCRLGTPSSLNTSFAPCAGTGDYAYSISGYKSITTLPIAIPSTGFTLDFFYSYSGTFSFPTVEIRTGGTCGSAIALTHTLSNTSGACTQETINLDLYAGQTIFVRFNSNSSSYSFSFDDINVCGNVGGNTGDYKWADNFNDNNLTPNFAGNDGDEHCSGCGDWTLSTGANLQLAPSGGWNGNSVKTEAFPSSMANVYYVKLDRNEYIESPTIDMSEKTSLKISFYAKSSSSGTGGGDTWSSWSDHLRLQIWDGSAWITVKDITEGAFADENKITPALPLNYFCFSAFTSSSAPGNYYYTNAPNVDPAYFHADFKFRVIFEGGFSGAPFAWVDDFTFRADADGYSTMIPCGLSFWNEPMATAYGQDPGATLANDAERGVELELDNAINIPPNWATQANDGDQVSQVFGAGESERIVFCVLSEQEINFAFPKVHYSSPSIGNRSVTLSKDNNYSGPGWKYYAVEYVSCDLASSTISEPSDQFKYHYTFEYGNEYLPVFYHLNSSGIESGGGATSSFEQFDAPDVVSTDNCGMIPLPVELVSLSAQPVNNRHVEVTWKTVSEHNNDYFLLERSSDGDVFTTIASVSGAGDSQESIQYAFTDKEPLHGTSYYRLQQIDFDGRAHVSPAVSVRLEGNNAFYPNPTTGILYIQRADIQQLSVLSASGEVLLSKEGSENMLDVNSLPNGVYFLQIISSNNCETERFIKH